MLQALTKEGSTQIEKVSQPNPLQKKCLKSPFSIFSFISLPQFSYSQQQFFLLPASKQISISPQKTNLRSRSISPKKRPNRITQNLFLVQETELRLLFQEPLYSFSKRLSKGSNKNFCNIKVFSEQSITHLSIKNQAQNQNCQGQESDLKCENLLFQSRFESGNLGMATKSTLFQNEYYLLLTKDFNTARCTQWFFFQVCNKKTQKITFHILNFFKNYSSFEYGMKICVASKSNNYTWIRGGQNIQYRKTNIKSDQRSMYCLSFTYDFRHNQDVTYFSYSYPYTYSKLDKLSFQLEEQQSTIVKRRSIGSSLGGNSIDMLTITNFKVPSNDKKVILITARVHPGQTPSSFVMEGIIKQLTQTSKEMENAREKFIFKLIPMLNPDGVINGNYRCSLSGYDLNRSWKNCDKDKFPEIYSVKKTIQSSKRPYLFIDLHAHSKKKGAFMYGCSIRNNPFLCRQIPFLLWKHINEFNYFQCNFSTNSRQREGTARMNMFQQFGVALSYTMEHSFCGPLKVKNHFTVLDYLKIGSNLISTIEKYYGRRRKTGTNNNQMNDLLKELYENKDLAKVGEGQGNDSSSDSELDVQFEVDIDVHHKLEKKKSETTRKNLKSNFQFINDTLTKTPRQGASSSFNFTRSSSFREKTNSELRIQRKQNCYVEISKIGFNSDDYFKGSSELKNQSPDRVRDCYTSLKKNDEEETNSKRAIKPIVRYSEEEVNNLTNLFLPSVTSNSYKKYNKPKVQNKSIVHVGRKFLQNSGILKDQIKSALKRKIEWNNVGKGFLEN